jgi:hypothetical protein
MKCLICNAPSRHIFSKKALYKYDCSYRICDSCGFLFVAEPHWLDEAYSEALMGIRDTGMIQRNLELSSLLENLLSSHLGPGGACVDYGAGTGMLVRLMRDKGFDFRYYDPIARNIFARGFEAEAVHAAGYRLLTAIEVLEHTTNPLDEINKMLSFSATLFFTTQLRPPGINIENWSYLLPESGQHISLFSLATLELIAAELGLKLITDGVSIHILTRNHASTLDPALFSHPTSLAAKSARFLRRRLEGLAYGYPRSSRASLIEPDRQHVEAMLGSSHGATGISEPGIEE